MRNFYAFCPARTALLAGVIAAAAGCPDPVPTDPMPAFTYDVPLRAGSPWPKFRRTARQTGHSPVAPERDEEAALWVFPTGKGIFSTPVIDENGTVYVGSADRHFYAIDKDGAEKWRFLTGEIIDSSALLDDQGRVYFGSGDGHLYALDADTGEEVWTFAAHDPAETDAIINWFEGNVSMGPDGTLYVPNDNFLLYAIDRHTGEQVWTFELLDQTWSAPAVNPETGEIFFGNNFLLGGLDFNVIGLTADGREVWSQGTLGSTAASPLLTDEGTMVVGSFDGFVRAYDQWDGTERWAVGTRDHIYASPAALSDGTIIQASADGTVYALAPEDGAVRWTYDTTFTIRSSPAVDGNDTIYFGTGGGRLIALDADGTLRWSLTLIDGERDDLNASPALGTTHIVIAGESGEVFGVPYDYCLGETGQADARCATGESVLDDDGAQLLYTDPFGALHRAVSAAIEPTEALAFSLVWRDAGRTDLAFVDADTLSVVSDPVADLTAQVSGDRKYIVLTPQTPLPTGTVTLTLAGDVLVGAERQGMHFSGGTPGGAFVQSFVVEVTDTGGTAPNLVLPGEGPATTWEFARLAAPLPSILPSYNQIGFDSLHYLISLVEGQGDDYVAWLVGATLDEQGRTVRDPGTVSVFPLALSRRGTTLTMTNQEGFVLNVMGADIAFDRFRIAGPNPGADHATSATVSASAICGGIYFYGDFLRTLGFCHPDTDELVAYGTSLLRSHPRTDVAGPVSATVTVEDGLVRADLAAGLDQTGGPYALLLLDAATSAPVSADYGHTARTLDGAGRITGLTLDVEGLALPTSLRVHVMGGLDVLATATVSP